MKVYRQADLKKYSGFNTGGFAERLYKINTKAELKKVFEKIAGQDFHILGQGFNTLIKEVTITTPVLVLEGNFKTIELNGCCITAGAGASLSRILRAAAGNSMTGLECLAGVPGTAGGAVMTNCGAFGKSFAEFLKNIEVFNTSSKSFENIAPASCSFGYRRCGLDRKNIITEIKLGLKRADKSDIIHNIKKCAEKKSRTQPVDKKSCGCIFKNPPAGPTAGKIIEDAGLKGSKIGGAVVSEKHANYIINDGAATSGDILELIKEIKKQVKSKFSVNLQTEIDFLGFSPEELND